MRELHHLYVVTVSNPFTPVNASLSDNKNFDAHLRTLVRMHDNTKK